MGCAWSSGRSSKKKRSQTVVASNYNKDPDDPKQFKPDSALPDNQLDVKEEVPTTIEEEIKEENPSEKLRLRNVNKFTYQEMVDATENFKPDYFIGRGGFGKVYNGILKGTNEVVAIKRLDHTGFQGDREFDAEVMTLSVADHPNLVKLLGYCAEEEQRLLVYEFMPLGSLETHLHDLEPDQLPLDWNTRMKIAVGAAMGLEYLHTKMHPPIIYRDLKSPNILLDENYNPKLSDFGLAKVGPQGDKTHVTTRVMGTDGYCAPEYLETGQITFQSDIFSFGVLLLELITGGKALHKGQYLVELVRTLLKDKKNYAKMADPGLNHQYPAKAFKHIFTTALLCVRKQPNMRPLVADIVKALNYIAAQKYEPSNCSSSGQ